MRLAWVLPLELVHVIVYVVLLFSGPTTCEPDTARAPLQAPDAAHESARELVQVSVLVPPGAMSLGFELNVTVGRED